MHTENFDHFLGQMVTDPFAGLDAATQVQIVRRGFTPNDPPGLGSRSLANMAHYEGVLLSVHLIEGERHRLEGSAVMVAPGIAFMATHVLESYVPDVMPDTAYMLCIGYTSSGPRIWRVRYYHKVEKSDLTILLLEYASPFPADHSFGQAVLTTRLPAIGEPVMIVGLRASDQHIPVDQDMSFAVKGDHLEYGANVLFAVGEVAAHYRTGRGSMPPGPAIEVSCSTPGGLSGGPAFDKDGRLVGILSNSINNPDGRGPSYVSLLWTAVAIEIPRGFFPVPFPEKFRLLDSQWCEIDRRDAIRVSPHTETGQLRIEVEDDS